MWQLDELEKLRANPDLTQLNVYGSAANPSTLDGWSDLDLQLQFGRPVAAEAVLEGQLWAWQRQHLTGDVWLFRLVFVDGRRFDIHSSTLQLPAEPPDNAVRFDAALAATKFGRGSALIGMHLLFGLARQALVVQMELTDRDSGTNQHRHGNLRDQYAETLPTLLAGSPTPSLALAVAEVYGRWREELDPDYRSDWTGLAAVIDRGLTVS